MFFRRFRFTTDAPPRLKTMAGIFTLFMLTAIITEAPARTGSGELVVRPEGPVASIAEAIQKADAGTTIRIMPGTYRERELTINKRLTLAGEGFPVIDAGNEGYILKILADSVQVRGLEFRNTGISYTRDHAAILIEEADHVVIEGNRFIDNFFGIYLATARNTRVADNLLTASGTREASSGNGIHLWSTWDTEVTGNTISGHRDGIYLEFAKGAIISGNTSNGNLRYGLHFMFSDDSHYHDNTFSENGAGVAVMYSRNVKMTDNRFTRNWGPAAYGLLLKDISDSEISGNLFRDNTIAIHSEGSNRINVHRNRIESNGWAVKVMANSQNNVFSANNFIGNTFDVATNSRRNYNTFEGNYWSRYDGYDLDKTGVGDVPHRPVRLYSLIVEQNPASLILIRSFFIDLLDLAERIMPTLTPETLIDEKPLMREVPL
jgi:nitrous oxidase accessory protein